MIRKLSKKLSPKLVLDGKQLQSLVTDLTEAKEVAIIAGSINRAQQAYCLDCIIEKPK